MWVSIENKNGVFKAFNTDILDAVVMDLKSSTIKFSLKEGCSVEGFSEVYSEDKDDLVDLYNELMTCLDCRFMN